MNHVDAFAAKLLAQGADAVETENRRFQRPSHPPHDFSHQHLGASNLHHVQDKADPDSSLHVVPTLTLLPLRARGSRSISGSGRVEIRHIDIVDRQKGPSHQKALMG